MTLRIWQTWLPAEILEGVLDEEPRRFAALSRHVCAEVAGALRDEADPDRWHRLVKWLSYVNTFTDLHQDYPAEDVRPLAEALWRAVAEAWEDLEAQVRMADCLTKLLRAHKRTLRRARMVLPWRPVFAAMQRLHGLPHPKLEGVGLVMARGTALYKLVAKARRYFSPGALGEVWSELRPAVVAVERRPSEGYEALGYLQLFAPTHNICHCNWSAVNGWLREWMAAWDLAANSSPWDSLWLALMSRAAKHDWRGIICWQSYLPSLYATMTSLFDVPVGSSRGVTELVGRATPGRAALLFGEQMGYGPFHAARLAVHLLRCTAPEDPRGADTAASASAAASHLEHLTALLEQYYHPSNTGKWCRELSTLLKHLVKAAVKQLERQQPPAPPPPPTPSSSAVDQTGDATAADVVAAGEYDEYDYAAAAAGAGGEAATPPAAAAAAAGVPRPWVSELREPEIQRLAACCVTLAARGQFSKDAGLANVSIKALSQLAILAPSRVLPLVLERFRTALASATATHQLVAAIGTLALCTRPLLLAGWAAAPGGSSGGGGGGGRSAGQEESMEEERETAPQLVSEALMATLPGLDANDESKTNAVLQLYVAAMSALPRLRGAGEEDDDGGGGGAPGEGTAAGGGGDELAARDEEEEHGFARSPAPAVAVTSGGTGVMDVDGGGGGGSGGRPRGLALSLYMAEWAEEVLERCLALLQNLDSGPAHRGTDLGAGGGGGRGAGAGGSTSSFLAGARSLFSPMWQLLMHHSRPSVRRHLVQRLATFVMGGTAPGVATEVGIIASQAAAAAPRETLRTLVLPLLSRVEAEVAELPQVVVPEPEAGAGAGGGAPHPPSASQEATLRYQLSLLYDTLGQLHADVLLAPDIHALLQLPASLGPRPPRRPPAARAHGEVGARQQQQQQQPSGGAEAAEGAEGVDLDLDLDLDLPAGSLMRRVLALSDALAGVNCTALQQEAGSLAGLVVMMLARYWMEPHLPWRQRDGGTTVPVVSGRGVELWVDKYGTGYPRPRWCRPDPAHLVLAGKLLRQRLVGSAQRLRSLLAGAGGGGLGDGVTKLRLRAELLGIRGMLIQALSILRDFRFGQDLAGKSVDGCSKGAGKASDGGGGGGVPLAVFGGLGAAVGEEGSREAVAEALVEVCSLLRLSGDPELLELASRCASLLLSSGSVEHVTAHADERNQRATSHLNTDAPAAAGLAPGLVWRRRSPMWVVQARLFNGLMARASVAAFRSWATTERPEMTTLEQFPRPYLSLLRTMCALAQHPNTQLARNAGAAVEVAMKRFPCLAPAFLPYFLAALADVPYASTASPSLPSLPPPAFFDALRDAALAAAEPPPPLSAQAAVAPTAAVAVTSESELHGQVLGSCHTINATLNFWRLISRQPKWLAAMLHALLAARRHNASVPQKALGELLIAFAGRFLHPPAMSYGRTEYGQMVHALEELARPGGMARRGAPFRYTVIANVLLALLLPHRYDDGARQQQQQQQQATAVVAGGRGGGDGGSSVEVASLLLRHMLDLAVSADAPQLRQLGMSGTFLPLSAVVEFGQPMPQLLAVLREAIAAPTAAAAAAVGAVGATSAAADDGSAAGGGGGGGGGGGASGGGDWGAQLLRSLVLDHSELDNAESMKDKRGASLLALQQRVLNMTFEEMAGSLAGVPMDRLSRWPADAMGAPTAVSEGAFVVRHARLVQLMAAAAPAEMLAALRTPLEALTSPDRLSAAANSSDKAELAAAAEALAGLLASGAPWAAAQYGSSDCGGEGGGWAVAALARAVRGTSLEMSGSWALSYRYAVRGLLDGLVPERVQTMAPYGPDAPPQPRAPLAAGLTSEALAAALGDLLGLTVPRASPAGAAAAAAATAAAAAAAESVGSDDAGAAAAAGGLPGRIKRLRCLGAVVRELYGLDPAKELPLQVRLFWSGLLDELHFLAASSDCLRLRDQMQGPLTDAIAYFGGAEGLLGALPPGQLGGQPPAADTAAAKARARGPGGNDNGNGNGNDNGRSNGGNGDGDLVHVSAEPSGICTPAEMELGEGDETVLVLPQRLSAITSMAHLRRRARSLALSLASGFNAAAVRVQEARGGGAAAAPAAAAVGEGAGTEATSTPRGSTGGGAGVGDSPASRATTDDVVLVEAAEVVSVSGSGTTSPGAGAETTAAAAAAGTAPMDVDVDAATAPAAAAGGAGTSGGGAAVTAAGDAELAGTGLGLGGAVCSLGLGMEVLLMAASRHRCPAMRELVVAMLPGVLRLQDVAGPELQKFAKEFQATLFVIRCLSLNTHHALAPATPTAATTAAAVPGAAAAFPTGTSATELAATASGGAAMVAAALEALSAAAVVEVPWSARAAALSYAQTLWFRHAPLLSAQQLRHLQDVVAGRLPDPKAEVRSLAAATLSGLLRGTSPDDVAVLRKRLLDQAAQLFGIAAARRGGGSRRRGSGASDAAAAAAAPTPQLTPQQLQLAKQGCVAGLSALLMSYPYDLPTWLPPVLMALVRAAGGGERDGAVRGEAGRALGEFRRTHEVEAMEELRAIMNPDDWDSFTQATGGASYFV